MLGYATFRGNILEQTVFQQQKIPVQYQHACAYLAPTRYRLSSRARPAVRPSSKPFSVPLRTTPWLGDVEEEEEVDDRRSDRGCDAPWLDARGRTAAPAVRRLVAEGEVSGVPASAADGDGDAK